MGPGRAPLTPRLAALLALCLPLAARAQAPPRVEVEAVPELSAAAPGGAFRVAVRLRIPDGCHLAWVNPGETGLPTTLAWRTPGGVTVGETEWPYPERDEAAGLVNHVYRGAVVVVTTFQVTPSFHAGAVTLRADLTWGLCGATCIRQTGGAELSLPVREGAADTTAAWRALAPSLAALPIADSRLAVQAAVRGDSVRLTIAGPPLARPGAATVTFFPLAGGTAVVAPVRRAGRGLVVTLPRSAAQARTGALAGVLVADRPWLTGSSRRALRVEASVPPGVPGTPGRSLMPGALRP